MTYDLYELRTRVREMRTRFIRMSVVLLFGIVAAVISAIMLKGTTERFVAATLCIILLVGFVRNVAKSHPVSLFSREIRGKNVKEHEYVIRGRRAYSRYLGFYKSRGQDTGEPRGVIGAVYILEDTGDVTIVDHLHKSHTDIYDDGDRLLKPGGARYPIIIGREVKRQPCPLCGEVNSADDMKCKACGLGIIKGIEPDTP